VDFIFYLPFVKLLSRLNVVAQQLGNGNKLIALLVELLQDLAEGEV
jgi:hypothetical protein